MIVWPTRLFRARSQSWSVTGSSIDGGRPATGSTPQRSIFGGGGLLMAKFSGIRLREREQVGTWRALNLQMDGGANPVIVEKCERRATPRLPTSVRVSVPHSDGTFFSDGAGYVGGSLSAETRSDAAFRATRIRFRLLGGRPLIGGEAFSIDHPTAGWRLYQIASVESAAAVNNGFDYEVTFRPPLRESVDDGVWLEMERPRCLMRLVEPDGMNFDLDLNRFADVSVSFVEDLTQVGGL